MQYWDFDKDHRKLLRNTGEKINHNASKFEQKYCSMISFIIVAVANEPRRWQLIFPQIHLKAILKNKVGNTSDLIGWLVGCPPRYACW